MPLSSASTVAPQPKPAHEPVISCVIPAFNEAANLRVLIHS